MKSQTPTSERIITRAIQVSGYSSILFVFLILYFLAKLLKGLTLLGNMAFHSLLKGPGALFHLFSMLLETVKR